MSEDKYRKLIELIELNKIELLSLDCNQKRDFPTEKRENLDIALRNENVESKLTEMELQVQIKFGVIAFNAADRLDELDDMEDIHQEDILFKIEFSLMLKYVFNRENSEDIMLQFDKEIDRFIENNVPLNAWPYARETISSITTRMGFPALIIPTYKNLPPQ